MGQGLVTGAMFAGKPFQIRTGWTFVARPTLVPGTDLAVVKFGTSLMAHVDRHFKKLYTAVLPFPMWSLAERATKPLQGISDSGTFR